MTGECGDGDAINCLENDESEQFEEWECWRKRAGAGLVLVGDIVLFEFWDVEMGSQVCVGWHWASDVRVAGIFRFLLILFN